MLAWDGRPQMIHLNLSGLIINRGSDLALNPIKHVINLLDDQGNGGLPLAFSLNEICATQALSLLVWLQETYQLPYEVAMFVHAREVEVCPDEPVFGNNAYGSAVLTVGSGHKSGVCDTDEETGIQQCGTSYHGNLLDPTSEGRGTLCLAAGMTGTKGYACTTHLQNVGNCGRLTQFWIARGLPDSPEHVGWRDCHDDEGEWLPPDADWSPNEEQFLSYFTRIRVLRNTVTEPVNFAGDVYLTSPQIQEVVRTTGINFFATTQDADPHARETWKDGDDLGRQVDHIFGSVDQPLFQSANLWPVDTTYPTTSICPSSDPTEYCSDHRMVLGYISFDGSPL